MVERVIPQGVGRDEKALVLANSLLFEKYFDIASLDAKTDAQKEAWDLDKPKLDSEVLAGEALEEMLVDMGGGKVLVRTRGMKIYEYSNHLGNVLVTISDKVLYEEVSGAYIAQVATAQDYYPFGSAMPGRKYEGGSGYRFGFNGKHKDSDINSGAYDFGARVYDGRLGRWWGVDPLAGKYPSDSPYGFCLNNPVIYVDPDGRDVILVIRVGSDFHSVSETKKMEIENSSWFNKDKDAVFIIEATSWDELQGQINEKLTESVKAQFGQTTNVVFYSHGGSDGPIGSSVGDPSCKINDNSERGQMKVDCWATLDFNLNKERNLIVFEGCKMAGWAARFLTLNPDVQYSAAHGGSSGRSSTPYDYYHVSEPWFGSTKAWQVEATDDCTEQGCGHDAVPYMIYRRNSNGYPTFDQNDPAYVDPTDDQITNKKIVSGLTMDKWGLSGHSKNGYSRLTTKENKEKGAE